MLDVRSIPFQGPTDTVSVPSSSLVRAFANSWRDRRPARPALNETPTSRRADEDRNSSSASLSLHRMLARTTWRRMTRVVSPVYRMGEVRRPDQRFEFDFRIAISLS
jgi:hypothetical protein